MSTSAFPNDGSWANNITEPGLTKREYFAALAMQGDWAAQNETSGCWSDRTSNDHLLQRACLYYRMADAMLKAETEGGTS